MELKNYLTVHRISQAQFSERLGINHIYLNAIVQKRRRPSSMLALRIEKETDGLVSLRELLTPNKGPLSGIDNTRAV